MKLEKENTTLTDTPEIVILQLLDYQINILKEDIKRLKQLKEDIFFMMHSDEEYDWNNVYLKLKGGVDNETKN